MRIRARHLLLLAVLPAACSAFSSTSDAPGVVAPEVEASTSEASSPDVDGAPIDAPPPRCAQLHDFCASFDDVVQPDQGWAFRDVSGGGSLQLTTEHAPPSAPNALLAKIFSATQVERAWLYVSSPAWPRGAGNVQRPVHISLSVFPETVGQGFGFVARHLLGGPTGVEDQITLALVGQDAGADLEIYAVEFLFDADGSPYFPRGISTGLHVPQGAWSTVVLDVSERSSSSHGTITVGVGADKFTAGLISTQTRNALDIAIGLGTIAATTSWGVAIDDVVADWTH